MAVELTDEEALEVAGLLESLENAVVSEFYTGRGPDPVEDREEYGGYRWADALRERAEKPCPDCGSPMVFVNEPERSGVRGWFCTAGGCARDS